MSLSRLLIAAGLVLLVVGALVAVGEKLGWPLGRLPGDLTIRGRQTTVYFPIVTCILLSVIGSLLLWLFGRR